jgi:bifunctional non-homologous end joining protein LigD
VQLVHASEDGVALREAAIASGFEGVIGKRKGQPLLSGKRVGRVDQGEAQRTTADFVIGRLQPGQGLARIARSILVVYLDHGKLKSPPRGLGFRRARPSDRVKDAAGAR